MCLLIATACWHQPRQQPPEPPTPTWEHRTQQQPAMQHMVCENLIVATHLASICTSGRTLCLPLFLYRQPFGHTTVNNYWHALCCLCVCVLCRRLSVPVAQTHHKNQQTSGAQKTHPQITNPDTRKHRIHGTESPPRTQNPEAGSLLQLPTYRSRYQGR